ncbi:hypothetical protein GALMADRAFT_56796 [Galerina marginata CBS 339.88]|uniref:T6SS Phospholipase effector Tle1-like catalytic domain-containing protein n=1 Tax=Galerina marginata (strain CBS 339.88) TaxID=685588 RepID=A0A067TTC6_GALM3|nr:hypothetical protein GALMADRAFT_56796 [Galerina marginata CBS 339.88]
MTSTDGHVRLNSSASDTATLAPTPQPSGFAKSNGDGTALPALAETTPPDHPFRTLVLCFDGTGDQFDADNSNIVELFSMLKKDDPSKQLVYYQAGIGTYTTPQIATPGATKISQSLDMAVAWNLDAHIMGGYEFLMQNYRANDRICIFGFSRGAYTARCLAGMIHKVGLLPAYNHQQVPFAYKMYTTTDDVGWKQSNAFKKTFSIDVDIEFLGVWDTVNAVGLIPRRLPFTTSNTVVRTFRHAVSLDERRAKFKANLWNRPTATEQTLSITDKKIEKKQKTSTNGKKPGSSMKTLEERFTKDKTKATDIDEVVWFAGCHCDIGGGSVSNGVKPCLSRIPFRWMIRECFKTNSGILFHTKGLAKTGLDPKALYPVVLPRPPALNSGVAYIESVPKVQPPLDDDDYDDDAVVAEAVQETEEELDLKDALAPVYDQLNLSWWWWLLEFLPMKQRFQEGDNSWATYFGWNLARGRYIPKQNSRGVRVHRSVKTRLEAEYANGQKYTPKANLNLERVTWVD